MISRLSILGFGLMGASFAAAIRDSMPHIMIRCYDPYMDSSIFERHFSTIQRCPTLSDSLADAELVMLAVPPSALEPLLKQLAAHLTPGTMVSDMTSVKSLPLTLARKYLPTDVAFIPSHPIAGKSTGTAQHADAKLFQGKKVILTPNESQLVHPSVQHIAHLWRALGAEVRYMPAELHDTLYARISHLPQLVAFACKAAWQIEKLPLPSPEQSFTRLWESPVTLWADIFRANQEYLLTALHDLLGILTQMHGELSSADNSETATGDPLSCIPPLIAAALIASAAELETRYPLRVADYAGAGFTDMTAAARGSAERALGHISQNPRMAARFLGVLISALSTVEQALQQGHTGAVLEETILSLHAIPSKP